MKKKIEKEWWFWVIVIFVIIIIVFAFQRIIRKQETESDQEKQQGRWGEERGWQNVITFQGDTKKATEEFKISSNEWRVKWSFLSREGHKGVFIVKLEKPNEEFFLPPSIINYIGVFKNDTTYIYQGNDFFYFDITYANGDWILEVEEKK